MIPDDLDEGQLEAEDPSDSEPDLGAVDSVSLTGAAASITPVTETVASVLGAVQEGAVVLQPPFQRRQFWDNKKKAALIESVFLGLPLPLFYLADDVVLVDGEEVPVREVVDGQQRLTALRDFYSGDLTVTADSVVEDLRGKRYSDLRPALKSEFRNFKLSTATIPTNARADKFELFKRLNQRATVLSDQELRNAAYHGPYLDLLKDQAEILREKLRVTDADWSRMKDVEYLTRLVAFERRRPAGFPNKRLNKFLNDEMDLGNQESERERARRIRRIEKALTRCSQVFGELRFRPFRITEESNDGEWARTLNRALMEVQVYTFSDHADYEFADAASFERALRDKREEIIEYARRLHAYNERFNDTLQRGTTGKPNVEYRFERYRAMLKVALSNVTDARRRRFFTRQQKQNIWDRLASEDRVCAECGHAVTLDIAEVDHIEPFAEGGETTEANGQLIHPACNRAKGARWDPVEDVPSSDDRD